MQLQLAHVGVLVKVAQLVLLHAVLCVSPVFAKHAANGSPEGISTRSTTIIDILSQNVEFSIFLRIVQKKGLIPDINLMTNVTCVAPVNSAFAFFDEDEYLDHFDVHSIMRYFVNDSFVSQDIEGATIYETMQENGPDVHTPMLFDKYYDPETHELLFYADRREVVEPNMIAYGSDCVVHGINELLPHAFSTCEFLQEDETVADHFSVWAKLFPCEQTSETTALLIPDDFVTLNSIETAYLSTTFGQNDRDLLLNQYMFNGYIGGEVNGEFLDFNGESHSFESSENGKKLAIDGQEVQFANIMTKNAVLHVYNKFRVHPDIQFNAEKYMYGLGLSESVEQLHFHGLENLVQNNSLQQTIFVFEDEEEDSVSAATSSQKRLVLYHFVEGHVDLSAPGIYTTKVCFKNSKKIGSTCQALKITHTSKGTHVINDDTEIVGTEPISVGGTDIYYVNKELSLPLSLKNAVKSVDRCTKSMKYLDQLSLLNLDNNNKGYTVFLPCFNSWDFLDLTLDYLETNMTAMELILKNSIVDGIAYSDFTEDLHTTNYNNEETTLKHIADTEDFNHITVEDNDIYLTKYRDIFFDQGVVHPINGVAIPKNVEISLEDLVKTMDSDIFLDLLEFTNLSYVLHDSNYSVLYPSKLSLVSENYTRHTPMSVLQTFLKMHILPNNLTSGNHTMADSLFNCGSKIPTLLDSVHLSCRSFDTKTRFLQIVEGANSEVRILKSGCTTFSNESCVFVIDRVILPDWLNTGKKLKFGLPYAALGLGFIMGVIFIFICVPCCLFIIVGTGARPKTEDSNGDETQSLLGPENEDEIFGDIPEQQEATPISMSQ